MKIVIDHTIHPAAKEMLEDKGRHIHNTYCRKKDPRIYEADALIIRTSTTVDRQFIDSVPNLQYIGTATTGLNHIDTVYAQEKNIRLFHAPGANADSVADYVFTWVLNLNENILYTEVDLRKGSDFAATKKANKRKELGELTLGVIGFGNVGSKVATRARAFGMKVLTYDPYVHKARNTLDQVLSQSDIVTLHPELTQETTNLIGLPELQKMKDSAYLINASRGEIVDEQALITYLKNKKIQGAVLDVFHNEPSINPQLKELSNVHITPHIAGNSMQAKKKAALMVAEQLIGAIGK